MKFHAILRLVEDILLCGAPSEVDTGGLESHHRTSKVAAKMTQRKESTFDCQTGLWMTEFLAIDLVELEVEEGITVFDCCSQLKKIVDLAEEAADQRERALVNESDDLDHVLKMMLRIQMLRRPNQVGKTTNRESKTTDPTAKMANLTSCVPSQNVHPVMIQKPLMTVCILTSLCP